MRWRQPPVWASAALSLVLVADVVHFGSALADHPVPAGPVSLAKLRAPRGGAARLPSILAAHLFGVDPVYESATATAPPVALTLSGVIATQDPSNGAAILGAPGQPTRLYRAGTDLSIGEPARLQQVFANRVVVSIRGELRTIALARVHPSQGLVADAAVGGGAPPTELLQSDADGSNSTVSPASGFLASLNVESQGGRISVYPTDMSLRHTYHIRMGDEITAVNGASISDIYALQAAMAHAVGPTSVTIVHNGVPVTIDVPQVPGSN